MYFYNMLNLTPFLLFDGNCAESYGVLSILLEWRIDDRENRRYAYDEPHAAPAAPQSCSCSPEKQRHRVFGHGLAAPEASTKTGKYGRYVHQWRNVQRVKENL